MQALTGETPALLVLGSPWLLVSCPFKEQQVFAIDGEVRDYSSSALLPMVKAVDSECVLMKILGLYQAHGGKL